MKEIAVYKNNARVKAVKPVTVIDETEILPSGYLVQSRSTGFPKIILFGLLILVIGNHVLKISERPSEIIINDTSTKTDDFQERTSLPEVDAEPVYSSPVYLSSMQEADSQALCGYYDIVSSMNNRFSGVLFTGCSARFDPYAIFPLNRKYSTFTGVAFIGDEGSLEQEGTIRFTAVDSQRNERILKEIRVNGYQSEEHVVITGLENVDLIKISMFISHEDTPGVICLADAQLY